MNKLTDSEIVKSLESLLDIMRAYESLQASIGKGLVEDIISMYNRQKAEIENNEQRTMHNSQLLEVLREKCIEKQEFLIGEDNKYKGYVSIEDLDNIINDMKVVTKNATTAEQEGDMDNV